MTKELKMLVGVALLATLALAGALGIFTFSAAQPVGAQADLSASRTISPATVAPEGTVTVTIAPMNVSFFAQVVETLPSDFTYVGSSLDDEQVDSTDPSALKFICSVEQASPTRLWRRAPRVALTVSPV